MTYAPPAYPTGYGPQLAADPTQVMGRRIGAFFIDWVPIFVLFAVLFGQAVTHYTDVDSTFCDGRDLTNTVCFEANGDAYEATDGEAVRTGLIPLGVGLVNLFLVEGLAGGTVGKLIVGLRVVRADGRLAGFGRAVARGLLLLVAFGLSFLFFVGVIVELIVACVTKPHRRIGDMAAGTYVVSRDRVGFPVVPVTGPYGSTAPPPAGWGSQPAWGPPTPQPQPQPQYQPPYQPHPQAQPAAQPQPAPQAQPAAQPQAQSPPQAAPPAPQWDLQLKAWITWDPDRNEWLQWDDGAKEWRPLR